MKKMLAAAGMAVAMAASSASAAELLTNGDFATHDFTGWTFFTTANGSLGVAPDPRIIDFPTGTGTVPAAEFQVGQIVHVGGLEGGGISQTIDASAGELDFSVQLAAYDANPNFPGNGAAGLFAVLLDGVVMDSVDLGPINKFQALFGSLAFSTDVTAGQHVISLSIERAFQHGVFGQTPFEYFAQASATQVDVSGAPEPAAWALMIGGFGLVGAMSRRSRSMARAG